MFDIPTYVLTIQVYISGPTYNGLATSSCYNIDWGVF